MSIVQKFTRALGVTAIVLSASGCAWLTTYNNEVDLNFSSEKDKGKAVFVDAKQRAVIQKSWGAVCAEPSPDALASLALSASSTLKLNDAEKAQLAAALSESAGSIGLRTQSIQLMRDALYRVCEMYFSRGFNSNDVYALHQKYQDTMLAVLAVEQLTGAITPSPVSLSGEAQSKATQNIRMMLDQLAANRDRKLEEKEAVAAAEESKSAAEKALEEAKKQHGEDSEEAASAAEELSSANDQLDTKKKSLEDTEKLISILEESKDAYFGESSSSSSATAEVTVISNRNYIDSDTAEAIAGAIQDIVKTTSEKNYLVETCIGQISRSNERLKEVVNLDDQILALDQDMQDEESDEKKAVISRQIERAKEQKKNILDMNKDMNKLCTQVILSKVTAGSSRDADGEGPSATKSFTIHFSSGSVSVGADHPVLSAIVSHANRHPNTRIRITGHSDTDGNAASKQSTSEKRASTVKKALLAEGIAESRVTATGVADKFPAEGNETRDKGKDRRVEVRFSSK